MASKSTEGQENKQQVYTRREYLDALEQRVIIFDGAMGTSLQAMNLNADDYGRKAYEGCIDYLVISKPEAVEQVHRSFLEVGADAIETNTFRANRLTLAEYGLEDRVLEINKEAAQLARCIADEYSSPEQKRFVAGSLGPTGKLPSADDPDLSDITYDELAVIFAEQAVGLISGGVDLLLIETSQDLLEVKAAIAGIHKAFKQTNEHLPIQAQVTLDTTGRMLLGTDVTAAMAVLERLGIDVIGINCSTGPEHMRESVRYLGENATLPISVIPNAGLPLNVDGEAVYPLEAEPFADDMIDFIKNHNVNIVGGCCGTTPEHIKFLADAVHGRSQPSKPTQKQSLLSSSMRATPMLQVPGPLLIGERINTQGSRAAKRLLLAEEYDEIIDIGRRQVDEGAHALDVSVALTERDDELETMVEIVHRLSASVEVPLVIDTTETEVMEAALKVAPGRYVLNSVNLEAGREKLDRVLSLAVEHAAAVIVLTIDEQGMANTAQRKLDIARRISTIAIEEFGLQPDDLIFDPLTFTLATGDVEYQDSARETIEGIRLIKQELPGVFTSLGVSNVSFGLSKSARPILNSVMLYHCVQAGLDMAIVNPALIEPYAEISDEERALAEDLIFNHREDALQRMIEHYEGVVSLSPNEKVEDPTAGFSAEERIHWRILHRHKQDIESDIDEILARDATREKSATAIEILNEVLLPAMREVGDKFGDGELILPFVLQSAEVMKLAVSHVEQFLERKEGMSKGIVVLATVYGDVHDIGKNLVKTILSNNGYEVIDLGKQVPANIIIDKALEVSADAIGLSALLVSTSRQMPYIVNELVRKGQKIPVLIGGAAINRKFGRRILFTENKEPYSAGVFYCKDAFEGLAVMNGLQDPSAREQLMQDRYRQAAREIGLTEKINSRSSKKSALRRAERIPTSPTWGARSVLKMPLEMVFQHISKKDLFRLSWGAKNAHGERWKTIREEFEERLAGMQQAAIADGWLDPQGVYGYWPVQAQGDDLILYEPETLVDGPREVMRFSFPRQPKGEHLCLADYFAGVDSGSMDVAAFQIVTVGSQATSRFDALSARDEYSESYFLHGLAVQTAEATAEYLHQHIRRELGIPPEQGKRYSWGYPAIPDLADHAKIFSLLPAEEELGMSLSVAFQLIPEQSTAAIILHHPQSKYFNIGQSRIEQLMDKG